MSLYGNSSNKQLSAAAVRAFGQDDPNSGAGAAQSDPGIPGVSIDASDAASTPLTISAGLPGAVQVATASVKGVVSGASAAPQSTANAGAVASTSSAIPSWIGQLSTPSIAAGMAAAITGGTVTYAGLEALLANLDSTLNTSRTSLTAAEFSDLKTIAANLNNGVTTSAYLTGIMNALVTGNAANATWTGGNASPSSLGQLAAGSSATQLSELIGKWFLGTDLPSSKVAVGYTSFSVSYSSSSSPVFAAGGPSMNDINQGYLGDCYLLSSLAEVAHQDPSMISSMITSNGNGTYGVRFYVGGAPEYVTVNSSLADAGSVFNYGTDIWASLVEKAYAQLQAGGEVTGNYWVNFGNSWTTIGNGGYPEFTLEEITNSPTITDFYAAGRTWTCDVCNSSFALTAYSNGNSTAAVQSILAADLRSGDDLVLSSNTNAKDSAGKQTLVADHAMSIYGFDTATSMFEIRNPWGTYPGQYWDTTFEVSLSTLLADGDTITADAVGGSTPSKAPVLTSQTATQTWRLGQTVNFSLSASTFTDPQGQRLTYTATQANGAPLPSWLTFNAGAETFTGTVPNTAAGLTLQVTATDTSGLSSSETFSVLTPGSAPVLTSQTAAQTWNAGQKIGFSPASNTFTDPQGEKLTYTAAQANGATLPSWLSFNGTTDTFTGTAPKTAAALSLKVTATDASGLSASETFNVSIAATAISHAIAGLNGAPPAPAMASFVQPMQGLTNNLFAPKAQGGL